MLLIVVVTFSCVHDHGPCIIRLDHGNCFFFMLLIVVVTFFCVPYGDCHLFLCSEYGHHFFRLDHSCFFVCF
jgi:hypothetical protein